VVFRTREGGGGTTPIFIEVWDLAKRTKKAAKKDSDAKAFAVAAGRVAAGRHCRDILVLDLKGKSPATDYFVIATGTSDRQMRTVADEISEEARKRGLQRFGRAGYEQARWILLDFIDVVIHIFDAEYRDYYDLELLWGDADRLKV
jgi:ribosome-associated protein